MSLVADREAVSSGESVRVGVYFEPDPDWHIYWINPGDSGQPPDLEWRVNPKGTLLGPLRWPYPTLHETPPLSTYVYDRPVLIGRSLTLPAQAGSDGADIAVRVKWLACKEACEPGETDLRLRLRGPATTPVGPGRRDLFALNETQLPDAADTLTIRARTQGRELLLTFAAPGPGASLSGLRYFPVARDLIDHAAPQKLEEAGGAYRLTVPLAVTRKAGQEPGDISGLFVVPSADVGTGELRVYPVVGEPVAHRDRTAALVVACALAFIGGLVLNLMPCVLPVLSLKVLRLAGSSGKQVDRTALAAYASGVIGAFGVVGASVLALKALGAEIGWGFQMQSPAFILLLIQIFVLVGVSLIREVSLPISGIGVLRGSPEIVRSVWEGILSVLAATPCIAPFMGSAVGYALSAGAVEAMLVFVLLATGYCAPIVLLAMIPAWRAALPRPGPWMGRLKIWMLLPVVATVLWLAWVLSQQVTARALLAGLVLTAMGLMLAFGAGRRVRAVALIIALTCIGGAYAAVSGSAAVEARSKTPSAWSAYDPALLRRCIEEGRAVFIDFTAAWCLTCQVNKRLVLETPQADRLFSAKEVVRMRADWTSRDAAISRQLRSYGRSGVPVYVFYPAGSDRPLILPEILTPDILREALEPGG